MIPAPGHGELAGFSILHRHARPVLGNNPADAQWLRTIVVPWATPALQEGWPRPVCVFACFCFS